MNVGRLSNMPFNGNIIIGKKKVKSDPRGNDCEKFDFVMYDSSDILLITQKSGNKLRIGYNNKDNPHLTYYDVVSNVSMSDMLAAYNATKDTNLNVRL